jgi:methyl-accepting chemotaxis protein
MDPEASRGLAVSTQVLVRVALAGIITALGVLGLGIYSTSVASGASKAVLWLITLVIFAIVVFVLAISGYQIWHLIRENALSLAEVCREAARGNHSIKAPVTGNDEFSMLAGSINALVQGSESPAVGQDAASLQAQIEKLLQEVSAVGDGDLRVQAEVTPDTLGVLADSFNYMIEELAKVVGHVQTTTLQVTTATRRILDRSAELAQASEDQVAKIVQGTQAVEALASFIQSVARNAQLSAEAAQEALNSAKSGEQAVVQTIDGMVHIRENVQETAKKIKRLGERSQEIGEIVRLIEDIADQTNLLALNAAIQSAMAGEHGRGFAVVADEIRLLAERSSEATKRISVIVKSIQGDTYDAVVAMEESTQEVVAGSRLADDAGRALQSIYGAVERQVESIEAIASSAHERAQTSEAVSHSMMQISDITRQTNVIVQEAAASVAYLAELAEQLRASVATFRLPDTQAQLSLGAGAEGQPLMDMPELDGGNTWSGDGQSQPLPAFSGNQSYEVYGQPPAERQFYNGNGQGYSGQQFSGPAYQQYP